MQIKRRGFLKGLAGAFVATQTGMILPYEPERVYSFGRPNWGRIADDFTISATGDIRYVGNSDRRYTVLEMHRFLQEQQEINLTTPTPSERATNDVITLINGFNIDDKAAQRLYGGSISQDDGRTNYQGLRVVGEYNPTDVVVTQSGERVQVGIDEDGNVNGVVKTRSNGRDIANREILVSARDVGSTSSEFRIARMGLGINLAALYTRGTL